MRMNAASRELLEREIAQARDLINEAQYVDSQRHLERAHVLGQAQLRWHVLSHWLMFTVALHRGQLAAALGQAIRLIVGAIGSAVGRVPVGNTGGSDVSMFRRMPIPPELSKVMERDEPTPALGGTGLRQDDPGR